MKKLSLQLTISLVSLFISLILTILGNQNKYCLSFGFIFFAIAIILFAVDRCIYTSNTIKQLNQDVEDYDLSDVMLLEIKDELKKLKKQRAYIIFGSVLFCVLLLILAFTSIV